MAPFSDKGVVVEKIYTGDILKKDTGNFVRNFSVHKEDSTLIWDLTQGQFGLFDEGDFDRLIKNEWRAQRDQRDTDTNAFYVLSDPYNSLTISAHRFLAGLSHGNPITVDHKNRNGLDNRKTNLRLATSEQQMLNRTRGGVFNLEGFSCNFRGVIKRSDNNRYRVRASVFGKQHNLGHFSCPIKAAECWDEFIYESFKSHDPLYGLEMNGIKSEPTLNFTQFNFPERLGL